jgi:hypothetical protein
VILSKITGMKKILIILFSGVLYYSSYAQSDSSFFTVRLSSFDVSAFSNIAKLHWKTVCYLQYANFEIQRSSNGTNYTTINSFTADRLRCLQPFDFVDSLSANQGNIFYRINVGNIDGTFYNSAVRRVYLKEKGFDLIAIYPTIVTSSANFTLSSADNKTFYATIINQSGVSVKKIKLQVPKGLSYYSLHRSDLPPGYYWLQVLNELGEVKTEKFIKQ